MADNDLITSPSKLDIYSKLLDIAKNYIGDDETDYLKAGLFGYMTESMAMMMRDSSIHKTMLYNESFLNTAIIPQSVYNWAKMFNVEVNKASPAYATIKIIIEKNSLKDALSDETKTPDEKYGLSNINNKYIIIDKENMIIAGEYYFSLEHSILIEQPDKDNTKYTAKYITTEPVSTEYQTVNSNVLLPVTTDGSNIEITARAYQYKVEKIERQLSSTRMLNKVQLYDFEDQFAGARLVYTENGTSNEQDVTLLYSNIGSTDSEKVAYYSLNNEHQLEIMFKGGDGGFIPAANSKIKLYLYTTKGADVPSNFSGDAIFRFNDDTLRQLAITVQFNPTTIIGGTDTPSVEKIKQTVIRQLSTCNTIVTENDINNYFSVLTSLLETINNGKVTFIKTRDDIMRRVFNAYVLLRDGMDENNATLSSNSSFISKCVPTNTITADFPASTFTDNCQLIFPKLVQNTETNTWYATTDNKSAYYFSPFYIYVSLSPIKKVKYIYNLTDCTSSMSCTQDNIDFSSNGNSRYINPISMRLYRGVGDTAKPQDYYTLTATFSTNFENLSEVTTAFGNALNNENNGCTLKFSNTGESEKTISVALNVDDFDEDTKNLTLSCKFNTASDNEFDFANSSDYGTTITLSGGIKLKESYKIILSINNGKTNEYTSDDKLYLFRSLDEIMSSDISVNTTTESDADGNQTETINSITISDIPVVHSSYLSDDRGGASNRDKFVEQLFTYISLLKENLDRLETSTFFNLKFYNTYGPSYIYNTVSTNLNLELVVHVNTNDSSLENEIKSYIRRAVDKSNDNSSIKISQIIALLGKNETYGQYITYIEFKGLNGTFNQYINKNPDIDESKYPPEWLNIDYNKFDNIQVVYDAD